MTTLIRLHGDTPEIPRFQRYQYEFTRHLRNPQVFRPPQGVAAKRIGVYAELLRNKIEDSLLSCFPISRELLGKRSWNGLVKQFIAQHECVSPLYRQIPDEFIVFLHNERSDPSDPPFLAELAHFEWMELVISIAKDEPIEPWVETAGSLLDGAVVFAPNLQWLRYRYPVQRIAPEQQGWRQWKAWRRQAIEQMTETTFILGFRDRNDEVRFIEINAATARLIELLDGAQLSGRQALLHLAIELRAPDAEAIIEFGLDVLGKLQTQGAILGTQIPHSPSELT
ncbi:MAG: putative DNA-binding domain-containing protein [Methylococcaceae bacterium]|nr:putative DNA-binding domain-containing protein [Methylococcaceae bacterium]